MTHLPRRSLLALAAALPLPALAQGTVQAPAWPDRPIKLVIPVAPGGSLDILGRTLARELNG